MSDHSVKSNKVFRQLNKIVIRYIPIMVLVYFTINVLGLVLPLTMKNIYGNVISSKSELTLKVLILGTLIALLLETILKKVKDSSTKWIASVYEYKLSNAMIEKILCSSSDEENKSYIADLEKINSASVLAGYYSSKLYQLIIDLPFMIMYLYLIYLFGDKLVLIPITLIVIYVCATFVLTYFYSINKKSEIEKNDDVLKTLSETLEKIHTVKGAGIEAFQIKFYKERLNEVTVSSYMSNRIESLINVFTGNYSQITLFAILLGGGALMGEGLMTFGEVTGCAMLGSRAISPIMHVMDNYHQNKEMSIVKENIIKLLSRDSQYEENAPDFPNDLEGTIEIINLEYEDIQSKKVSELSVVIPKNSFVSINPREFLSYRSVINKLYGKEKIERGNILIDNLDIARWNMNSLKGKMEYLQSNFNLVKGTVLDNIVFYDYSKSQNAYIAANLTGLDELVSQMPDGFETQLDSYFSSQLSPAFLQKLNLTRALVDRPRILILDRLDESMDEDTKEYYKWLLESLKGSMTIIVVTTNSEINKMKTHTINELGIVEEA